MKDEQAVVRFVGGPLDGEKAYMVCIPTYTVQSLASLPWPPTVPIRLADPIETIEYGYDLHWPQPHEEHQPRYIYRGEWLSGAQPTD